jgi:hypothetical protein
MSINLNVNINYRNNKEYRAVLREIFNMDTSKNETTGEIDGETEDELLFDNKNILKIFDDIYEKTFNYTIFQELFEKAAACFFSTDEKLGITVLFAYDYLEDFYPFLCSFLSDPKSINESHPKFQSLKNKLSRR